LEIQFNKGLLLFGGTYGNLQATEALFGEAERLGFGADRMVCTGDLAAYCAQPQETVDLVRHKGVATILGNCEENLAEDADDCGCGFEDGTACDLMSRQWYTFCREKLNSETKRWMGTLPRTLTAVIGKKNLRVVHGGLSVINEFIFPSSADDYLNNELNSADCDGILAGHSGIPFARVIGEKLWLNSGAVGIPANDGTNRVWYAIIEPTEDGLRISTHPLTYDHETAASEMHREGLTAYADALESGHWPSTDVLPEQETAETGQRLEPLSLAWTS
jgi:predicted phosphodiesterase